MNAKPSAIGLDIGTSRLVTATRTGDKYEFHTERNAFLNLPFSKVTASSLTKANIPHEVQDGELLVFGDESERFANMLNLETRRPMLRGLLNPAESNGTSIIRQLLTALLGDQKDSGTRLCYSVPGAPASAPDDLKYHEATVSQILTGMGYDVTPINEGLAVVFSELEDTNFTGIGISCGGGMCNLCLAYLSMPVFSFSVSKGGDFIDESAASVIGEGATRVRSLKEQSFHFNGFHKDKVNQALNVYYDDMIQSIVDALREFLSKPRNVPRLDRPIPVVISGGSSMPAGFRDRFEKLLAPAGLPIRISEVRMAADPLHSTAKGALVAALAGV